MQRFRASQSKAERPGCPMLRRPRGGRWPHGALDTGLIGQESKSYAIRNSSAKISKYSLVHVWIDNEHVRRRGSKHFYDGGKSVKSVTSRNECTLDTRWRI